MHESAHTQAYGTMKRRNISFHTRVQHVGAEKTEARTKIESREADEKIDERKSSSPAHMSHHAPTLNFSCGSGPVSLRFAHIHTQFAKRTATATMR